MSIAKLPLITSLGGLLGFTLGIQNAWAFRETYEGTAKDLEGRVVYLEKHEVLYDGPPPHSRVLSAKTQYLNPDGTRRAELTSEFKGPSFLPSYSFQDSKLGISEGVRCCNPDSTLEVYHQGKTKRLRFEPEWVSGQGFHYFSRASLDPIAAGENRLLQFLIPSRLDTFQFQIRKGDGTDLAKKRVKVVLEVKNWLLRIFAPSITATYDTETRRLLSYLGPSNLQTDAGEVQTVTIEYRYP